MPASFIPYNQDQMMLMPLSLRDWVADDSLEVFVSDLIDDFDVSGRLAPFYARYREDGRSRPAYDVRCMLKMYVFGYCHGITSSRKLARACSNEIAFRYLTGNQCPDFHTIAKFRRRHLDDIRVMFKDVLEVCMESGLVKLGRVALDGRRVKGNASKEANRTEDSISREIDRLLAEAEQVDQEEDATYGADNRGDELPEKLRTKEERKKRLEEARRQIDERKEKAKREQEKKIAAREKEEAESGKKKRGRKPKSPEEAAEKVAEGKPKANTTDPDSRIIKTRDGYIQGYNGQAVADCESQVVVAEDVTNQENDINQLIPMMEQTRKQAGGVPEEAVADAGYCSTANLEVEDDCDITFYIATQKDHKQRTAPVEGESPSGCATPAAGMHPVERMNHRLGTEYGKEAYGDRGHTIEGVFGQMVNRGLLRFNLRGLEKVKAEWSLWCTTHNILKLWRSKVSRERYAFAPA